MTHRQRVEFLVVGGGIGGTAAALALARRGKSVHVLEKGSQFGELGAGLQVAPNASRVLDRLGVLDEIAKDAFFPRRLVLRDALSGEQITALDTGEPFARRYGYRYFVAHRADLHHSLLQACRATGTVTLEAGREVTALDPTPNGAVVTCADGSVYESTAVIGADGLRSTIRHRLIDDGEPVDSGFVSYRGTKPMDEMRSQAVLGDLDEMVIWTGPRIHFVQYPVRRGELCNQVATLDTGMFDPAEHLDLGQQLDRAFAPTCSEVRHGAAVMDRSRRWELVDRLPAPGWSRDHMTLVGDAAHPMLQYVAQGACQAIEDGLVLAECLTEHDSAVAPAFKAYEAARYSRASRIQTMARQFGEILHIGGMGASLRTALLRQRRSDDYTVTDWLYSDNLREVAS